MSYKYLYDLQDLADKVIERRHPANAKLVGLLEELTEQVGEDVYHVMRGINNPVIWEMADALQTKRDRATFLCSHLEDHKDKKLSGRRK